MMNNKTQPTPAKPIILSTSEVRQLRDEGCLTIRRGVRRGPGGKINPKRFGVAGDRLWIRESVAVRLSDDHQSLRLRYRADPLAAEPRVVPYDFQKRSFATATYRTSPGRHCPRWASRLVVRVADVDVQDQGHGAVVVLDLVLIEEAGKAVGSKQ